MRSFAFCSEGVLQSSSGGRGCCLSAPSFRRSAVRAPGAHAHKNLAVSRNL